MSSSFPIALDNLATTRNPTDMVGPDALNHAAAINNIEAELGLQPRGTFASVAARLNAIQHIPTVTVAVAASNAQANFATSADYVCDGTGDQVEINAAIASLPAAGGQVLLSEGTFTVSGPIVCQKDFVVLRGMGRSTTIIKRGGTYTDSGLAAALVQINRDDLTSSNRRPADSCEVRDLTIDGSYLGTQATTHGLHFKCFRGIVDNIQCRYNNARGLVVAGATAAERGTANEWSAYGTRVTNCKVHHNGSGGVYFASGSTDASFDHTESFQNAGPGFETGAVVNEIAGCFIWGNFNTAGGTQGNGILLNGGAGRCNIYGNKIEQNRGGLRIVAGSAYQVVANVFASNSTTINGASDGNTMPSGWYATGANNTLDDIMIDGTGGAPTDVRIIDNIIDPSVYSGDRSRYAINFSSGDKIHVAHNSIGIGLTGQVWYNIGSNNVAMMQNLGFVTEASGQATITSAATSVTVTHGLAVTPKAEDIVVTLLTNTTNDIIKVWVGSVGSTTFTINVGAAPGTSTAVFGWSVGVHKFS